MKYDTVEFTLHEKKHFRVQGFRNGRKFYYYKYPKNTMLYMNFYGEPMPRPKYDWQIDQMHKGVDITKYMKTIQTFTIKNEKKEKILNQIKKFFEDHPRHKYVVVEYNFK